MNKAMLERLYVINGMAMHEIADKLGMSSATIWHWFIKFDIPRRRQGGSHFGSKNPAWKGGVTYDSNGYVLIMKRGHPHADSHGHVKRSILVWEKVNGRPFPEGMEPHHKNEVKDDDRPENIEPKTHSAHAKEHQKKGGSR